MNKITHHTCDFCEMEFDTEEECEEHEKSHIRDYSEVSNAEIVEELNYLGSVAYDYQIGNAVMGLPVGSFENLMDEVAKRLRDEEF